MSLGHDMEALDAETRKEVIQDRIDRYEHDRKDTPKRGSDWGRAKGMFPSVDAGVKEWVSLFDKDPQIMWSILGDVAKAYKATEGPRKTGRRPGVHNMSLRELESIVTPRYCMEPFAAALPELIGKLSLRHFASKVPCHHHTLTRLMRGELPLTRPVLESIARAGKVSPSYFVEYRAMYVADMVTEVMLARPNVSITAVKRMAH